MSVKHQKAALWSDHARFKPFLFFPAWFILTCLAVGYVSAAKADTLIADNNNANTASFSDLSAIDVAQIKKHQRQLLDDLGNKIQVNPQIPDNYFRRAFIYYQLKMYKDALKDCQRAISFGLENANVHLLNSEILFALKRYTEALPEINRTLSLDYSTAKVYGLAAQINNQVKDYAKGLQYCSKAIDLEPSNPRYYEIRAELDYKVEQYLRCIKDASKAIELDPDSGAAYSIRSKANLAVKDFKQAQSDQNKAKELN